MKIGNPLSFKDIRRYLLPGDTWAIEVILSIGRVNKVEWNGDQDHKNIQELLCYAKPAMRPGTSP